MRRITKRLVKGQKLFKIIAPSPANCLKIAKGGNILLKSLLMIPGMHEFLKIETLDEAASEAAKMVGSLAMGKVHDKMVPLMKTAATCERQPLTKVNGIGGRSWINNPSEDERMIKEMRVVYHSSFKAGEHIDIHIGPLSLVMNISGKPEVEELKFNSKGELTKRSKDILIGLIRNEAQNNSRVIQNVDHSVRNAASTWLSNSDSPTGYGAGKTRQPVLVEDVEIMSVGKGRGKTIRFYSPTLNPNKLMYIHKLYGKNGKKSPILIWGNIKRVPQVEDRLHLKEIKGFEKFMNRVDKKTTTRKMDGASAYFFSDDSQTTLWSPRTDKDGNRIQYTMKVPQIHRVGHKSKPAGMGELVFREKFNIFKPSHWFGDRYLSAAQTGGILNSHQLLRRDLEAWYHVYRMDKWDGKSVIDQSFFENRKLQKKFARMSQFINAVTLVPCKKQKGWEGLVAVPVGGNITNGYKIVFQGDIYDWEVTSVDLKYGPTGRTAGVIRFKSLDSGKKFKLGPGQLGTEDECLSLMEAGNNLIGFKAKVVNNKVGHEGRSAKLVGWTP